MDPADKADGASNGVSPSSAQRTESSSSIILLATHRPEFDGRRHIGARTAGRRAGLIRTRRHAPAHRTPDERLAPVAAVTSSARFPIDSPRRCDEHAGISRGGCDMRRWNLFLLTL